MAISKKEKEARELSIRRAFQELDAAHFEVDDENNTVSVALKCPRCIHSFTATWDINDITKMVNFDAVTKNDYVIELITRCPHCNKVIVTKVIMNTKPYKTHKATVKKIPKANVDNSEVRKDLINHPWNRFDVELNPWHDGIGGDMED